MCIRDSLFLLQKREENELSQAFTAYNTRIVTPYDLEWECPQCGNKDHDEMNVTRRTCGYLGENFWNVGKTKEIASRVLHI